MTTATTTTADHDPLTTALVDKILHTQRRHLLETGRKISPADALGLIGMEGDDDLNPVREVLATMLYSPSCQSAILGTIRRDGSAQCGLTFLSEADRAAIEAAIPEAPKDAWKGPKRAGLLWGGMVAR